MDNDYWIAFSTYRKPDAIKVEITSAANCGYNNFLVTDDFNAQIIEELGYSALDVFNEFKNDLNIKFLHGPRGGISINKNRAIHYFLTQSKAKYLLLMDDDL